MPAPPPPPPAPTFNLGGGGSNDRGALLQSIRDGKRLKKTVTVDKSGPAISGKICGEPSSTPSNASPKAPAPNTNSINNGGSPMGLGGLFAGGMPKLKPTGMRNNLAERDNGNGNSNVVSGSATLPSVKRGPPPVPPPAAQKPQLFSVNNQSPESSNTNHNDTPRASYGKPTLAPKPPTTSSNAVQQQKPSPPPKKLSLNTNSSVSRAQSMRLPRSPQVLAPTPPSLHQSQDCLVEPQQRPTNRPLGPPVARPPSPPTSRSGNGGATITRVAPPPPTRAPSMPPPPPPPLPQRSTSSASSSAAAPPPPPPTSTRTAPPMPPPPTPPTRGQSLQQRNGQAAQMMSPSPAEFEARFADMFHSIANFPSPEPFRNVQKVYNSKTVAAAKQQAPAPPVRSVSNAGTGGPRQPAPQPWQNAAC